jgi:hypothetical protein
MGRSASILGAAAFGLALAGCASLAEPHSVAVLAAYSILAASPDGGTVALARVIVDAGRRCPQLETDSGAIPTAARTNPDPMRFPVTVCEAVQPGGDEVRVSGADIVLPRRPDRPARIAVLGDTGCGTWQDCADPEA